MSLTNISFEVLLADMSSFISVEYFFKINSQGFLEYAASVQALVCHTRIMRDIVENKNSCRILHLRLMVQGLYCCGVRVNARD